MSTRASRHSDPQQREAEESRYFATSPVKLATPQQAAAAGLLRSIRIWLAIFIAGLMFSGITAFPLETESLLLVRCSQALHLPQHTPALHDWLLRVSSALTDTNARYPFLAYGTDWLAFGHLVIAVAFIGPLFDPVRNKWLITFGLIACAGVLPLAVIAGSVRGIPPFWRLIDCSFGIFGAVPLLICRKRIRKLEQLEPPKFKP